jgi:hypothetical protein
MRVETGSKGPSSVLRLPVASQRDEEDVAAASRSANHLGDLIAIQPRQAKVDQSKVGTGGKHEIDTRGPALGVLDAMTLQLQKPAHRAACVGIVLDQGDTTRYDRWHHSPYVLHGKRRDTHAGRAANSLPGGLDGAPRVHTELVTLDSPESPWRQE